MPMRRMAEVVGSDVRLRKIHKGRKRQQTFRFDEISKTIKSDTIEATQWKFQTKEETTN
jgi:hypothetical protein